MKKTLVLVANQVRARLFALTAPNGRLEELDNRVHPEGRLKDRDLGADRPGRAFDSMGEGRHAMGKQRSPSEQLSIRFAGEVVDWLDERYRGDGFERLVLVAPPRFLGLIRDALTPTLAQAVGLAVDKDLASIERPEEIRTHLPEWI